jgi:hypothetical protein
MDLKEGTVYLIRNDTEKYRHFEGTFNEYNIIPIPSSEASIVAPKFLNCFLYHRNHLEKVDTYSDSNYSKSSEFNPINIFCDPIGTRYYDAEKVKNGQKAIQQRERRTINMILRRLIGDDCFEW